MNLTHEMLQRLQALYANTTNSSGYNSLRTQIPRSDEDGRSYWATFSQPGASGEAGYGNPMEQGSYIGWNTADIENKSSSGEQYGKDGTYEGKAKYMQDKTGQTLLAGLAAMGAVYGLGGLLGGMGGAGAGAGGELANTLVSSTEFAAPGASSGTGLSFGGGSQGLTASAGQGLSLAGPSTVGMSAASPGAGAIGSGLGLSEMAMGSGSLLSPAVLKAAGQGAASSIFGDLTAKDAAKLALPAAGAIAGGQGQPGTESTRKLDPRMDPLVFGDGGLFSRVSNLLAQPGQSDADREKMRAFARGLLANQPAQNGFEKFYGGR